ncbi:MAG: hypothetical protein AAF497_19440 [Planctomycetota bacterium]
MADQPQSNEHNVANPYEPPQDASIDERRTFWTRKRAFFTGVGSILCAMFCWQLQGVLIVKQLSQLAINLLGALAAVGFLVGVILMFVYHWFPDPDRKYSWRRTNGKKYPWDEL